MDGWINRWMCRWVGAWMDGWIEGRGRWVKNLFSWSNKQMDLVNLVTSQINSYLKVMWNFICTLPFLKHPMLYKHIHHVSWFSKYNGIALYEQSEYALCKWYMGGREGKFSRRKWFYLKLYQAFLIRSTLRFRPLVSLVKVLMTRINDHILIP